MLGCGGRETERWGRKNYGKRGLTEGKGGWETVRERESESQVKIHIHDLYQCDCARWAGVIFYLWGHQRQSAQMLSCVGISSSQSRSLAIKLGGRLLRSRGRAASGKCAGREAKLCLLWQEASGSIVVAVSSRSLKTSVGLVTIC